jgi:hypothetical protein
LAQKGVNKKYYGSSTTLENSRFYFCTFECRYVCGSCLTCCIDFLSLIVHGREGLHVRISFCCNFLFLTLGQLVMSPERGVQQI